MVHLSNEVTLYSNTDKLTSVPPKLQPYNYDKVKEEANQHLQNIVDISLLNSGCASSTSLTKDGQQKQTDVKLNICPSSEWSKCAISSRCASSQSLGTASCVSHDNNFGLRERKYDEVSQVGDFKSHLTESRNPIRNAWRKFSRLFQRSVCLNPKRQKMRYKNPKSQELMSNTVYFFTRVIQFFRDKMSPDIRMLAEKLYFPTGQLEADGLCAITGQIWTASYLLQGELSRLREVDYDVIKQLYSELAVETEKLFEIIQSYHASLQRFKKRNLTLWQQVEKRLGIQSSFNSDTWPADRSSYKRGLARLHISKEQALTHPLRLKITTTVNKQKDSTESWEIFSTLDPAFKTATIVKLLKNSIQIIQLAQTILKTNQEKLSLELVSNPDDKDDPDYNLSCTKAIKILSESIKMLFEDVEIPKEIRTELNGWFVSVTNELHYFVGHGEWICDKFCELHDMVQLVYGYVNHMYGLDLPTYGRRTLNGESSYSQFSVPLKTDELVTKLEEKSSVMNCFSTMKIIKQHHYDLDDFMCTEYPAVLQKLPLRVGTVYIKFG